MHKSFYNLCHLLTASSESFSLFAVISVSSFLIILQTILSIHHHNIHLISDAFHSLLHVAAYTFSWLALLFSKKPANNKYTYGYTRLETISAFTNCIFLYFVTLFVEIRSIHNYFENGNEEKFEHK